MLTCFDVANYFIWLANTWSDSVTHLKLQKLVYYAQGFHLALYDEPLFAEEICAWEHGPVVAAVWHDYKSYSDSPITPPKNFDVSVYGERETVLLDGVYSRLGQYSAFKLKEMTHQEDPWQRAYPQGVITQDSMKAYFKTRLVSDNLLELRVTPSNAMSSGLESTVKPLNTPPVKSDVRESKGFQAYLASKKKRFEVYRRLAES